MGYNVDRKLVFVQPLKWGVFGPLYNQWRNIHLPKHISEQAAIETTDFLVRIGTDEDLIIDTILGYIRYSTDHWPQQKKNNPWLILSLVIGPSQ